MTKAQNGKIFCVGPNKTGTTSLHVAFGLLGIPSIHFHTPLRRNIKKLIQRNHEQGKPLLSGIEKYRAYSDWSNPETWMLFKELDRAYPGSKFILNTRDLAGWIKSREAHLKRIPELETLQKKNPDSPWFQFDKEQWEQEFHLLHDTVRSHFAGRQDDFMEFSVTQGDGWDELCPFLGLPVPSMEFPRSNTAGGQSKARRSLARLARYFDH